MIIILYSESLYYVIVISLFSNFLFISTISIVINTEIAILFHKLGIKSKLGRFRNLVNINTHCIKFSGKCGKNSIFINLSHKDLIKCLNFNYIRLIQQDRFFQVKTYIKLPEEKVPGSFSRIYTYLSFSNVIGKNIFLDLTNHKLVIENLVIKFKSWDEEYKASSLHYDLDENFYFILEFIPCLPPKSEYEKFLLDLNNGLIITES